jgi:hypothetical protein
VIILKVEINAKEVFSEQNITILNKGDIGITDMSFGLRLQYSLVQHW